MTKYIISALLIFSFFIELDSQNALNNNVEGLKKQLLEKSINEHINTTNQPVRDDFLFPFEKNQDSDFFNSYLNRITNKASKTQNSKNT